MQHHTMTGDIIGIMSKDFSLLLLHFPTDKHPRTWVSVKGKKMNSIVRELEKEVLKKKKLTRESLSKEIAGTFSCARGVIKRILQGKTLFYPIPIIIELTKRTKRQKYFLHQIENGITYLKINSASAKPVRAVKKLTKNLAKIIGAFMADGSLSVQIVFAAPTKKGLTEIKLAFEKLNIKYSAGYSKARLQHYVSTQITDQNIESVKNLYSKNLLAQTHYNIELTDEYKDSVEAFNSWMKETFDVKPTSLQQRKNAWRTIFSNKIIARFFMQFFDIIPGPKTYTAYEPFLIQKAPIGTRKSFARGVLMFDGCVTKSGKITLSSKSKLLTIAIEDIWTKDNIVHGKATGNNRGEWTISSTSKNKMAKLLNYFEPGTQKHKLLYWVNGYDQYVPIVKDNHTLSIKKVLLLLNKIKSCDVAFMEEYFKHKHITIRTYLNILKKQGIVRISNKPRAWSNYISGTTTVHLKKATHNKIFSKIKEKLGHYKNAAFVLGIHKATISAWKLQKSRMPLKTLRQLCDLLDTDFKNIVQSITRTDRDIVELI